MRRACAVALIGIYLSSSQTTSAMNCPSDHELNVYTPVFRGLRDLSPTLSEVLNLQVWMTLRKSQDGKDFGCGGLIWDAFGSDATLDEIKKRVPANVALFLWGQIQPVGDGVVVQSRLHRASHSGAPSQTHQIWRVELNGHKVEFDPIRQQYIFEPFSVKKSVLSHFNGIPNIMLCRNKTPQCTGPKLGYDDMYAVEQDGDFAKVRVRGSVGWVYVPQLSERSEVISFVAGVIRMMRGDYRGAYDMMSTVQNSDAGTDLKVEALIIRAVSLELQGKSGLEEIERARRRSPFVRELVQLTFMDEVRRAIETREENQRAEFLQKAETLLTESEHLFSPDDPWFLAAAGAIGRR